MALQSELFRGDPKLEAAATSDPAHITPGASGAHVGKIQTALVLLDDATIADDETARTFYGPTTASAVLDYKRKRNIVNRSYQTQADNIVGKMTMASLDAEMQKRPAAKPVEIRSLSHSRIVEKPHHLVAGFLDGAPREQSKLAKVAASTGGPLRLSTTTMELRRNTSGSFEVTNGASGTVQVSDPAIAKIKTQSGAVGNKFQVKKDSEVFQIVSGKSLGKTTVTATANGSTASLVVVVKTFGGPPTFHPGVHHDHKPSKKWDEVIHHPNNTGADDPLKKALDAACVALAAAADAPFPVPHGPEILVTTARALLFVKRPLASKHFEFYLSGGGKDFVEDDIIKDWIARDSGIRSRLKREIFPQGPKGKPRLEGQFFFHQREYGKDEAGQDFRFAFGSIDKVDFQVNLADHLVRIWFQDRYEWHPFYPKLYPPKSGDSARDDNCIHAALVEMQDKGAADYWMKGVAEVPLAQVVGP